MHMRLPHFECMAFVHGGAKRNFVQKADVDTGDGDRASLSAAHDRLPQHVRAVGPQIQCRFCLVQDRIQAAAGMCLCSHSVDATVRSLPVRHLHLAVIDIVLLEIDTFRSTVQLCHVEPFRDSVDRDDPSGP